MVWTLLTWRRPGRRWSSLRAQSPPSRTPWMFSLSLAGSFKYSSENYLNTCDDPTIGNAVWSINEANPDLSELRLVTDNYVYIAFLLFYFSSCLGPLPSVPAWSLPVTLELLPLQADSLLVHSLIRSRFAQLFQSYKLYEEISVNCNLMFLRARRLGSRSRLEKKKSSRSR